MIPINSPPSNATVENKARETSKQLEAFVVKQLLVSSGAFKGDSNVAGSSLTQEMFADTLAQAVAGAGGLGLAPLVAQSLTSSHTAPGMEHQTSGFGERIDPINGQHSQHTGVDIAAAEGTPIPAAKDGVVIAAGPRGGYGNAIEVKHADGTSTLYAHTSEVLVTPGDEVKAGDVIGRVGQTGRTTGPHLHLEVRQAGHFLNPGQVLKSYRLRAEQGGGGEP